MSAAFDLDLEYGEIGEKLLKSLLTTPIIEVKRDRMAYKTRNIAVEYQYKGKPSGIAITQSEWFGLVLGGGFNDEVVVMIKTSRLKSIARKYLNKSVNGGDNNQSKMVLIPIEEILK